MTPRTPTESTSDEPAQPEASPYHTPNAEGVFETPEQIVVGGMPVKTSGVFYLAHTPEGYRVGWFLHMRQPVNTSKQLATVNSPLYPTREDALAWLVLEVAAKFFSDHKSAWQKLWAWWMARPEVGDSAPADTTPMGAASAEKETVETAAPESAPSTPPAIDPAAVRSHHAAIPVDDIERNPHNPRREFDEAELAELVESIRAQGFLLQPIAVRDLGEGARPRYRLIAGERRWIAHQRLAWPAIEAKVFVGLDDARAGELALVENLQRRNLNAMEEALGFAELRDRYGYDVEKIAERTGKTARTIWAALRLVALPAEVSALIRSGAVPPSQGRWLAAARWAARPEHCAVLAAWIAAERVTMEQLGGDDGAQLPSGGARALAVAKLAVDVTAYRSHFDPETLRAHVRKGAGPDVVEAHDSSIWHLNPVAWKEEKKSIDDAEEERRQAEVKRAAKRVAAAAVANVNVKVEDLTKANLAYARLDGAEARYIAHLPTDLIATGVDERGAELVICLKPDELRKLKVREAELFAADVAEKVPALHDRATERLRKLRRIGPSEMAFIVDTACRQTSTAHLDGKAWERQGLVPPEGDLTRAALETVDPVDLARVFIESAVLNATGGSLLDTLRWVIEQPLLGLADETAEGREAILARAAREVFGTTDLETLAQWQKAHAHGMPVAEIARSYGATVEDVCGALGIQTPAA